MSAKRAMIPITRKKPVRVGIDGRVNYLFSMSPAVLISNLSVDKTKWPNGQMACLLQIGILNVLSLFDLFVSLKKP